MSTPAEEITIDLDAAEGAEVGERAQIAPDGTRIDPTEVKIEVAETPKPEKASKKEAAQVVTPDEGLEKLKKQLEDEKSARISAQTEAREAREAEARARNETQGTQLDLVKGAIASVTAANDTLEERYGQMLAAQDYAGAAKVQREMAANEAKLVDLNRGQKAIEAAPKQIPRVSDDPVERLASQLSPQSAAWVRSHPEFARDQSKYRKMIAAHELAMADGFAGDSPEYFASIEDTLKISQPRQEVRIDSDATSDAARPSNSRPSRQTAPPSAPVSRSGNGTGGSRPNVVTLSAEQVEMAKMMDMTPEQYAKQLIALEKDGKLSRTH
jgi:hypothetical protein